MRHFPNVTDSDLEKFQEVQSDVNEFKNYPGVEDNTTAEEQILKYIKCGHLAAFETLEEANEALGGASAVQKGIGLIVKERFGVIKSG